MEEEEEEEEEEERLPGGPCGRRPASPQVGGDPGRDWAPQCHRPAGGKAKQSKAKDQQSHARDGNVVQSEPFASHMTRSSYVCSLPLCE